MPSLAQHPAPLPLRRSSVTGRSLQTSRPHVNRRAGAATHDVGRTPAHPKIQSPRKTRVLPNPQARLMGAMRHENVSPPQCFVGLGYLCGRRTPCQPPLSGDAQPFASSARDPPTHEWASG